MAIVEISAAKAKEVAEATDVASKKVADDLAAQVNKCLLEKNELIKNQAKKIQDKEIAADKELENEVNE